MAELKPKPLLIYDGDCQFCRRWIERWRTLTQDRIDYEPYQKVAGQFREIPQEQFEASVQLIEPDGKITQGAEAVFRTLSHAPGKGWMLAWYETMPGASWISERFYRVVADHRVAFSRLTRWIWGNHLGVGTFALGRWLFLKLLALVYLVAFLSLGIQILGLVGSQGILPASEFLTLIRERIGPERYWLLPTLCWFNASDAFLQFLCWAGAGVAVLLFVGLFPVLSLMGLWILYLSLSLVCREFLSFQWDALLLETGFLAIFCAPLGLFPAVHRQEPPKLARWLLWWLLFRLMFPSGVVKLASGDPTWGNLTALNYHYETQPLPTWTSWYAHQLPEWFDKFSVAGMFAIELAFPFLIYAPRRIRFMGAFGLIFLQALIAVTGNYCFFNLLALILTLLLFDDEAWPRLCREWILKMLDFIHPSSVKRRRREWSRWIVIPVASVLLLLSVMQLPNMRHRRLEWPEPLASFEYLFSPFNVVNSYGLFAVMTTSRLEIIVEGSRDGENWLAYEFKHKPGDLMRSPEFIAPHQPRLDWQMWFAALGSYRQNPWFLNFCVRLLEGSPPVTDLLAKNPFGNEAPHYIRAMVYEYHFTDPGMRKRDKVWWYRELRGPYCPLLSLKQDRP